MNDIELPLEQTELRKQVESEIATYLRLVAAQPAVGHEVMLTLKRQAHAIETGQYKGGDPLRVPQGDRHV